MEQPSRNLSHSTRLRSLMQDAGISSFKALSRAAQVSSWQVEQLRRGQASQMRAEPLYRLSQVLQVPLVELLNHFSDLQIPQQVSLGAAESHLQQEYDRLKAQMEQQHQFLQHEFQQNCLRSLESWLIQFPTLAYAAQQNPQFPAKNFLPFIRPLEQLLQAWGVEVIAPVGAEVPYDPQMHQLLEGSAEKGDRVKVRYRGYRQGEKLLYRAQVSRVSGAANAQLP